MPKDLSHTQRRRIPLRRKILFVILLPVIVFSVAELGLRVAGYGRGFSLFVADGDRLRTDQSFPGKYFKRQHGVPELVEQSVAREKSTHALRVVCLGGSTTAGFPYEVNIGFPVFVKQQLEWLYPDRDVEVINLGISAVNSHAVADLVYEAAEIQPDLVLLYVGHNEFYGAPGLASSESIASSHSFIQLTFALREFRLFQLFQNALSAAVGALRPEAPPGERPTLMAAIVGKDQILPDSELYRTTLANFEVSLREIVRFWKEAEVPIVVSDLVSNLRHQAPLGRHPAHERTEFSQRLDELGALEAAGDWNEAAAGYASLLKQHPGVAEIEFRLGRCQDALGNFDAAHEHFVAARDHDVMPFRAPSAISEIIERVAREESVVLVSSSERFKKSSANGIPGVDLFLEHLHPNHLGYFLIAKTFVEGLRKNKLVGQPGRPEKTRQEYLDLAAYTQLDLTIADLKIDNLLSGYPFEGRTNFRPSQVEFAVITGIAQRHVENGLYWDAAHFELGDLHADENRHDEARREYRAVLKHFPRNTTALYKLGDSCSTTQEWAKAIEVYRKALQIEPQAAHLHAKLGKTLIISGDDANGITALLRVVELEKRKRTIQPGNMKSLHYLLGLGYARGKDYERASKHMEASLKLEPGFRPALELRKQLEAAR